MVGVALGGGKVVVGIVQPTTTTKAMSTQARIFYPIPLFCRKVGMVQ